MTRHIQECTYKLCSTYRAVGTGDQERGRGNPPPSPDFGRYVNPISIKGQITYAQHITTGPPDFWTFLRPWFVSTKVRTHPKSCAGN